LFTATVTLAAGGCGGSADSSSSNAAKTFVVEADTTMTAGTTSKAPFVAQVNKICREGWPVIRKNFAQFSGWQEPKVSKRQRFADSVRESLMAGIDFEIFDKIYRLKAPEGEKVTLEEIIGAMQEGVERGQREQPVHSAPEVIALFAKFNQRASQYGLPDCLADEAHLRGLPLSNPTGPPS
jgi:hypothetical protein